VIVHPHKTGNARHYGQWAEKSHELLGLLRHLIGLR